MLRRMLPMMAISAILHASALAQGFASVSGIVVDYPSSAPLPWVHVRLIGRGETHQIVAYGAVSDHDGRFSISHIPPGEYRASPDESARYFFVPLLNLNRDKRISDLTLKGGDRVEGLLLHLGRVGVITGRVIGDDGEPIEGARVSAEPAEQPRLLNMTRAGWGPTDDRGVYRLLCSPGKFLVSVEPPRLESSYEGDIRADGKNFDYGRTGAEAVIEVQPDSETRLIDISLTHRAARTPKRDPADNASVEGRVIDSATGKPLSHARVTLRPGISDGEFKGLEESDRLLVLRMQTYYAETKADGIFTMDGLAPGWYFAYAGRTGFLGGSIFPSTRYTLKGGEKTALVLNLSPAAAISGRVVDENGSPRAAVNVYATRDFEGDPLGTLKGGYSSGSFSNERGEFRIPSLAAGRFRVYAALDYRDQRGIPPEKPDGKNDVIYAPTFYPSTRNEASSNWIQVPAGGEARGIEIQLLRTPMLHVNGHVKSVPGAAYTRVEMMALDSAFLGEVEPGPDGGFAFWRLAPGRYQLIAYCYGPAGRMGSSDAARVEIDDRSVEGVELTVRAIPGANN